MPKCLTRNRVGMLSRFYSIFILGLIVLFAINAAGCSYGKRHGRAYSSTHGTAVGFTVSPASSMLAPEMSVQLHAFATFKDHFSEDVSSYTTWTVSDKQLASVDGNGLVKALSVGTVTVEAEFEDFKAVAQILITNGVSEGYITVSSQGIVEGDLSVIDGVSEHLHVYQNLEDGSSVEITDSVKWDSSNPGVAYMSDDGVLCTGAPGQAFITGEIDDGTVVAQFTVNVSEAQLLSISLNRSEITIAAGYSDSLIALASFDNGTTHNINDVATWSSSDPSVASVSLENNDGKTVVKVNGLKQGQTVVTATFRDKSAQCQVEVNAPKLVSLSFDQGHELSIAKGLGVGVTVTGGFSDGTSRDVTSYVTVKPEQEQVVAVESGDVITLKALTVGETKVTAEKDGCKAELNVTVTKAVVTALTISGEDTVIAGRNITLTVTGNLSDGTTGVEINPELWTSSDTTLAMVTEGVVWGLKPGTVTITAKVGDVQATKEVTVENAVVTDLSIVADSTSTAIGQSLNWGVRAVFSDGSVSTEVSPEWRSEQQTIATVSDGVVTGVDIGTATIVASLDGVEASKDVNVFSEITSLRVQLRDETQGTAVILGEDVQLDAIAVYSDGSETTVTGDAGWLSSDPDKALITGGLVRGLQVGTYTITARYNGHEDSIDIQFSDGYIQVEPLAMLEGNTWVINTDNILYKLGLYDEVRTELINKTGSDYSWNYHKYKYHVYKDSVEVTNFEIPDGVIVLDGGRYKINGIATEAFRDCLSLNSVTMHDNLTYIGERAFYDCFNLETLTVPDSVTRLGEYICFRCTSLTSVSLGDGITSINSNAFKRCWELRSLKLPANVVYIGHYAFQFCRSLEEVELPLSFDECGEHAFASCTSLQSVVFAEGERTSSVVIGVNAFSDCTQLEIHVPNRVTYIGNSAFSKVKHVWYYGEASGKPWGAVLFND